MALTHTVCTWSHLIQLKVQCGNCVSAGKWCEAVNLILTCTQTLLQANHRFHRDNIIRSESAIDNSTLPEPWVRDQTFLSFKLIHKQLSPRLSPSPRAKGQLVNWSTFIAIITRQNVSAESPSQASSKIWQYMTLLINQTLIYKRM